MNKYHFNQKWYIARISHLEEHLSRLPEARIGRHNGKKVIRIKTDSGFKEINPNSSKYKLFIKQAEASTAAETEIKRLKKEWKEFFKESYSEVAAKYVVMPNTTSPMTFASWRELVDNECPQEKSSEYALNGRIYRSRIERQMATAATHLRILFKYDCGIKLNRHYTNYLDFAFAFPEFNRWVICEVLGMLDKTSYIDSQCEKLTDYMKNNYYIGRDLFIQSGDKVYMENEDATKQMLINIVNKLSDQYVVLKPKYD